MGLFIGLKDKKEIDAAYYYFAKEIQQDAERHIERLRKRIEKFKEIDIDQIEDVIEEEVKEMTPEELIGTMDEYFAGKYLNINGFQVKYEKAKKKNYDEVKKLYDQAVVRKRADKIEHLNIFTKKDDFLIPTYFMAKNLTQEQIEEYLALEYSHRLEWGLLDAREKAASKVMRDKHKLSRNLEDNKVKSASSSILSHDIDETMKMRKIGTIERVQLLDERQKEKKQQLKISNIDFPVFMLTPAAGYFGGLVSHLLTKFTGRPEEFGFWGGFVVGTAAAYAALYSFNKNVLTDESKIQEAKDLGIYDAMVRAEEASEKFRDYVDKLRKEYLETQEKKVEEEAVEDQEEKGRTL